MIKIPEHVKTAIDTLENSGFEARLVGGCVRDMLRGETPHDWDIATSAHPEETLEVFRDFRTIETGLRHGTVTIIVYGEPIEITTYRVDGAYTDNRRPDSVNFSKRLEEDLARRDFTINAMAMTPDGGLFDPYGGTHDLERGLIRCVGYAAERFREDALRILRALRFASTLGFELEAETADAAEDNSVLLGGLSAERVQKELTLLLCGKNAGEVLRKYAKTLCTAMPELLPMVGFDQKNRHHCFDVWTHTSVVVENSPAGTVERWAALLHDAGKPAAFSLDKKGEGHFYGHQEKSVETADKLLRRLRFDNRTREEILLLVKYHDVRLAHDKKTLKKWLGRHGETYMRRLLALMAADNLGQAERYRNRQEGLRGLGELVTRIVAENECISLRDLAVNGDDMMALGLREREVGEKLRALLDAVIDGRVANEREALLAYAKRK